LPFLLKHLDPNLPAIKQKLAEQVIRTFTNESAVFRACKHIDDLKEENIAKGMDHGKAEIRAISQFAIEAALLKVYGSEVLDFVVDEGVQIHGGMGFSAETLIERGYRDSRINRIFEGTNEINRLLAIDTVLKKALRKEVEILVKADEILKESETIDTYPEISSDYFEAKNQYINGIKNATLMVLGIAYKALQKQLVKEQEIMMNIADMMIQLYAAESSVLRVQKLADMDNINIGLFKDMIDVFVYDAASRVRKSGMDAMVSFLDGEQLEQFSKAMEIYTHIKPVNVKDARRRIADKLIDENTYCF